MLVDLRDQLSLTESRWDAVEAFSMRPEGRIEKATIVSSFSNLASTHPFAKSILLDLNRLGREGESGP